MSTWQIRENLVLFIGLVLSVAVHEFGHAWVAHKLGDDTPGRQGRVTLNPLAHIDPIGTLAAPILFLFVFSSGVFFGWGKPVEVNPLRFTRRFSMRVSDTLVSVAGAAMNIVLAMVLSIILAGCLMGGMNPAHPILGATKSGVASIFYGLRGIILLNFVLAVFNMLPIPPLDGGHVLANIVPGHRRRILEFLEKYGIYVLLVILVSGVLRYVFEPVIWFTAKWIIFIHGVATP
jgi:Zn-dependent protease